MRDIDFRDMKMQVHTLKIGAQLFIAIIFTILELEITKLSSGRWTTHGTANSGIVLCDFKKKKKSTDLSDTWLSLEDVKLSGKSLF